MADGIAAAAAARRAAQAWSRELMALTLQGRYDEVSAQLTDANADDLRFMAGAALELFAALALHVWGDAAVKSLQNLQLMTLLDDLEETPDDA